MAFYSWCEERLQVQSLADDVLSKYVPAHVNLFYCFGGIVFVSFLIQGVTGFCLTIYYRPTVVEALESIQVLMQEINFGWFIRTLHRWSSGLMVLSILLHITRVYITSGFLKPRELTWISGVLLSLVTLVFGLTGYSLPWDQTGYWACKIVSAVPQSVDSILQGVGTFLLLCIRSSFSVSQFTLSRFYSLHALLLPLVLFVLVLFHFWLLRKQGISGPS